MTAWSREPKGTVAQAIDDAISEIESTSDWTGRLSSIAQAMKWYGAKSNGIVTNGREVPFPTNVVRQVIDSFIAKVAKHQPNVVYIPNGGGYQGYITADMRTGFLQALWASDMLHKPIRQAALDAALTGTGFLKISEKDGQVHHSRVFPEEIRIGRVDGKYGTPWNMFQVRGIDRQSLTKDFPSKRKAIENAEVYTGDELIARDEGEEVADLVRVVEAWRRGPKGRHVIVCDDTVLVDETWDGEFPFAVIRFTSMTRGYYPESLLTLLEDIQHAINNLTTMEYKNAKSHGMARTYLRVGSNVTEKDMTNGPGTIVEYAGDVPPIISAPVFVSQDVYKQVELYKQEAYSVIGLSEMSATGQKPAGLDSGEALRTYQDVETQRFVLAVENWEDAFITIAKMDMTIAGWLAEKDPSFAVTHTTKVYGAQQAKRLAFKDLGDDADYQLRKFSSSSLPDSLSGRIQMVSELSKSGLMEREAALAALNMPDTDRVVALAMADVQLVDADCDKILQGGEAYPDAKLDPLVAIDRARRNYLVAKVQGAPAKALAKVSEYMDMLGQVIELNQKQEQEKAQEQQPLQMGGIAQQTAPQTAAMQAPGGVQEG